MLLTKTRLGTVILTLTLMFSVVSCNRFFGSNVQLVTPKQVVDIPAMLGKSAQEITTMIGKPPYRDLKDLGVDWELPEGRLSLSALSDKNSPVADDKGKVWFISYELRSSKDIPFPVVNSIEDMAALVNIDLQGRKPDGYSSSRGAYYYRDVSVNGKKVGIDFSALDGKIRGVTVSRE